MVKKTTKEAKEEQLTNTDKEAAHKLHAVFTFIEGKSSVNTQLSTLGFDKNPGKLVTYLCMGVALAGKDYKIPVDELTKSINDFYNKFIEANSDNKEEK
jgi:hypothetical protein